MDKKNLLSVLYQQVEEVQNKFDDFIYERIIHKKKQITIIKYDEEYYFNTKDILNILEYKEDKKIIKKIVEKLNNKTAFFIKEEKN